MLDMTLEQGQHVFLKALAGNNFSSESIRAYNADIMQFVDFLKSLRVDWNNPKKIQRLDIVEFGPNPTLVSPAANSSSVAVTSTSAK